MGLLTNKVERDEIKPGDHIYTYRAVFTYSHHGPSLSPFLLRMHILIQEFVFYFFTMWVLSLSFSNWIFCIVSGILCLFRIKNSAFFFFFLFLFILIYVYVYRIMRKFDGDDVVVHGSTPPATGKAFVCFVNSIWVFVICKQKLCFFDFVDGWVL